MVDMLIFLTIVITLLYVFIKIPCYRCPKSTPKARIFKSCTYEPYKYRILKHQYHCEFIKGEMLPYFTKGNNESHQTKTNVSR